jgi:hypothetical protein
VPKLAASSSHDSAVTTVGETIRKASRNDGWIGSAAFGSAEFCDDERTTPIDISSVHQTEIMARPISRRGKEIEGRDRRG